MPSCSMTRHRWNRPADPTNPALPGPPLVDPAGPAESCLSSQRLPVLLPDPPLPGGEGRDPSLDPPGETPPTLTAPGEVARESSSSCSSSATARWGDRARWGVKGRRQPAGQRGCPACASASTGKSCPSRACLSWDDRQVPGAGPACASTGQSWCGPLSGGDEVCPPVSTRSQEPLPLSSVPIPSGLAERDGWDSATPDPPGDHACGASGRSERCWVTCFCVWV